ncbi:hypothetical protein OROGR_017118 [Orobanche gracilis]
MTISNLNPIRDNWNVLARVIRLWSTRGGGQITGIDFILMDDQGSRIQATVRKHLAPKYEKLITEGAVYAIRNFTLANNTGGFRVANHEYKITIQGETIALLQSDSLVPPTIWDLVKYDDILSGALDESLLVDVIGMLSRVGEQRNFGGGKKMKQIVLDNFGMTDFTHVYVKYGGYWDECIYTGGQEQIAPLPNNYITITNLKYCIEYMSIAAAYQYDVFCLSRSKNGRLIKSQLTTNDEVRRLCLIQSSPTVYVDLRGESSSRNKSTGISDLNFTCGDVIGEEDGGFDDEDDEDYVMSSDCSSSYESEEQGPPMNSTTFAEFAAWIRDAGGMRRVLEMMYPSVDSDVEYNPNTEGILRNWIVPMVPLNAMTSVVLTEENPILEELGDGSIFHDKEELNITAGLWNMENRAEYRVVRSNTYRLHWVCKLSERCPFILRAHCHGGSWFVSEFRAEHTCTDDISYLCPKKVHSKVIGAFFAKKMRNVQDIIRPKVIQEELRRCFGMDVKYDVALRGRNHALEKIYGKYDASFQLLPGYLHMLAVMDHGTITDLDVGPDNRFRHLFVALGACRAGFGLCMRPVIVVDGTHLKGKNNGILFVAVTKDANEQIYPLAFGIGPIENHDSWIWFLTKVRRAYGCTPNTLIVSDQHVSIEHAVSIVFPEATHSLCYYHLSGKIKRFGKSTASKPAAYEKLMSVGPPKWARSMCPVRRYSFLTSNAAESFNKTLLWAQRLPICSLVEAVRLVLENWFDDRRQKAARDRQEYPEEVIRKLRLQVDRSRAYTVARVDANIFKVETSTRSVIVDLKAWSYECMEFQFDLTPCSHAVATIQNADMSISQFIASFYKWTAMEDAYRVHIARVPHKNNWVLPTNVANIEVLPNKAIRMPGRPRLSRRKSGGEISRRSSGSRRCPHCDMTGHTGPNCPQLDDDEY